VGVSAFSGSLRGLRLVASNGVVSSHPPAGNANRWLASEFFMHKYLFVLLLVCLTASCTVLPVSDFPPTPSITSSKAPTSTVTPKPTATKPPTLTPSPTFDPYVDTIDSPDGKFSAKKHISWNNSEKPYIEIWDKSGRALWKIDYQYPWDSNNPPNQGLALYGWSTDSSKVYFYYSFAYDGWYTLFNGSDLQSLDAYTGEVKDVISGCCIAFAFTPEMDKIAYTASGRVGVLDLITGADNSISILPHSREQVGWVYISPSGEKVMFHTLLEYDGTAIFLDTKTMKQKIIMDKYFIESMQFDGWTIDENPRYLELGKDVFVIDLITLSRTVIGTPTPQP